MKYAIIAAGEGSRLAQEGIVSPKPLVKVDGEMLIDRLIRVFMANGASEIDVICNEQMKAVVEQHKAELRATEEELTALTLLRLRRDSLQVQWDVLGAKIKYIRVKQAELPQP